jgi:hypothetical protein
MHKVTQSRNKREGKYFTKVKGWYYRHKLRYMWQYEEPSLVVRRAIDDVWKLW